MKARISLGNITGLGPVDFSGLGPDFPGPWIIQLLNQCLPRARQTETVQKLSLELDLLARRLAVPPEAMAVPPGSPVVLVTGSSHGGIGYSLCEEFAAKGCTVYASARRLEAISSLTHPSIRPLIMDVTSDTSVRKAVEQVIEETGRLDIVVANAGIGCFAKVEWKVRYWTYRLNTQSKHWTRMFFLRLAQQVFPYMAARKKGTFLTIGSVSGCTPTPWVGVYAATKAAAHAITETLQMEAKALSPDIRVMLVITGGVR
ncbi:hypothetical protein FRC11_008693 [Ceratobasidium sp. 423]|nr:hypothetical protein FRC11_008693 [Ceratobasidium sp. 423]